MAVADIGSALPSAVGATENVDQLVDLALPFFRVATADSIGDAVGSMIPDHFRLDPAERRTNGCDLGNHIDTVAIRINHPRNPADLAFDSVESLANRLFRVILHLVILYPRGVYCREASELYRL